MAKIRVLETILCANFSVTLQEEPWTYAQIATVTVIIVLIVDNSIDFFKKNLRRATETTNRVVQKADTQFYFLG